MAELYRRRFTAVLAADTAFELQTRAATFEHGLPNQLPHAVAVEDLERVVLQDALFEIPSVICVRSFVPNEKNSATSAIWLAVTAARGTSIIVPTI